MKERPALAKSVGVPYNYVDTPGGVLSHTHPGGNGALGGTFSITDLQNFANNRIKTCRAVAGEGTYSISKKKNFNASDFLKFVNSAYMAQRSVYNAEADKLENALKRGEIDYSTYEKEKKKAFNTYLVACHSDLIDGQSRYGYFYTLELYEEE